MEQTSSHKYEDFEDFTFTSNITSKAISPSLCSSVLGMHLKDFVELKARDKNLVIIGRISDLVSSINQEYFSQSLREKLPDDFINYVHRSPHALKDYYGRASFFYVNIGPYKIPVLHPGAFAFESAVSAGTSSAIFMGSQQNIQIFGIGTALFLAHVLSRLASQYQKACAVQNIDITQFRADIYKESIHKVVSFYAKEDAEEHGRLVELKEILQNIGGENITLPESTLKLFYLKECCEVAGKKVNFLKIEDISDLVVDVNKAIHLKYQNIFFKNKERYIGVNADTELIGSDFLKIMKSELLKKKGICKENEQSAKQLKFYIDNLEAILENIEKNLDASSDLGTPLRDHSSGSIHFHEHDSEDSYVEEEQREIDYDLSLNDMLGEYYLKLKVGLDSLFKSAIIADSEIFIMHNNSKLGSTLLVIADLIPEFGNIFKMAGLVINGISENQLKRDLSYLSQMGVQYPELPEILSRRATILKRDYILQLEQNQSAFQQMEVKLDKAISSFSKSKTFSIQEKLAIKDTKLIEGCCISAIENETIHPTKKVPMSEIAQIIINAFKGSQFNYMISPDLKSKEQPPFYKRHLQPAIPESAFTNFPIFLKRKPQESYKQYEKRCVSYLKRIPDSDFYKLMGHLDPTNHELDYLIELMMKVDHQRHQKCNIF